MHIAALINQGHNCDSTRGLCSSRHVDGYPTTSTRGWWFYMHHLGSRSLFVWFLFINNHNADYYSHSVQVILPQK